MSAIIAEAVQNYPALAEMGIQRFHEISAYKLSHNGHNEDVLRIKYERAKGSLLPESRKYKFGRSMKAVIVDGGTARMEQTYEISPFLLKAVSELDALLESVPSAKQTSKKHGESAAMHAMIHELDQLDQLIADSMSSGDISAAKAKLSALRQQVLAL